MSELSVDQKFIKNLKKEYKDILANSSIINSIHDNITNLLAEGMEQTLKTHHTQIFKNNLNNCKILLLKAYKRIDDLKDKFKLESRAQRLYEAFTVLTQVQALISGTYRDISVRYYNAAAGTGIVVADLTKEEAYKTVFFSKDLGTNESKFKKLDEFKINNEKYSNTNIHNTTLDKMIRQYVLNAVGTDAPTGYSDDIIFYRTELSKHNQKYKVVRHRIIDNYDNPYLVQQDGSRTMFNQGHLYESFDQTAYDINKSWHDMPKDNLTATESLNNLITKMNTDDFKTQFFKYNLKRDNVKANIAGDVGLKQIKSNISHMADANFLRNRIYETLKVISILQAPKPDKQKIQKFLKNLIPKSDVEKVAKELTLES